MSAVRRPLVATSPDAIMSRAANSSMRLLNLIGSWAASGPQEAPAKITKPLSASAPARDELPRLPTSEIVEGMMVATPVTKITLAMISAPKDAHRDRLRDKSGRC
jgi:hypothetical protein